MNSHTFRKSALVVAILLSTTLLGQIALQGQSEAENCAERTGWTNFPEDRVLFDLGWHSPGVEIDILFDGDARDQDIAILALGRGSHEPEGLFEVDSSNLQGSREELHYFTVGFESGLAHQYFLRVLSFAQDGSYEEPVERAFRFTVCFTSSG